MQIHLFLISLHAQMSTNNNAFQMHRLIEDNYTCCQHRGGIESPSQRFCARVNSQHIVYVNNYQYHIEKYIHNIYIYNIYICNHI